MKFLTILAISAGLLTASQAMEKPSFHTKGTPTGKATGQLKPGEYLVEAATLSQRACGRACEYSAADHACVSQRHSDWPLDREHRH